MTWTAGVAIYAVIWWLVIFAVLPWGIRRIGADDVKKGHDAGAPEAPHILLKFLATTVIAGIIFAGVYGGYVSGHLDLARLAR